MEKEVLKRIFNFLEEKGEHNMPFNFKLLNNRHRSYDPNRHEFR